MTSSTTAQEIIRVPDVFLRNLAYTYTPVYNRVSKYEEEKTIFEYCTKLSNIAVHV